MIVPTSLTTGALKATKNSGLQVSQRPLIQLTRQQAMDHLLNNADKPVPEDGSGGDHDDDDDEEAGIAHIKKMGESVDDSELVAKVRPFPSNSITS